MTPLGVTDTMDAGLVFFNRTQRAAETLRIVIAAWQLSVQSEDGRAAMLGARSHRMPEFGY
jgi:hypothetical protein